MSTAAHSDSLFADRPFRFFWCARLATSSAYQMQTVGVGWLMYQLTDSALFLGLVGLVQFLPSALLVLVSGHVADRFDRRWIVRICLAAEALGAAFLVAGAIGGWLTRDHIFGFVLLIGTARAFETPALQALLPAIVTPAKLPRALAMSGSAMQGATIAGPALGGVLYLLGPAAVFAASSLLFVIAWAMVTLVKMERRVPGKSPVNLQTLLAGIAYIRSKPVLLGAISLDLFAVLLGGATALLPIFARDILHTGPWGLGLMRSAPAMGALAVALYLAHRPLKRRVGHIMFGSVMVFGVATLVFGLSSTLWISLPALVILGASDMISVIIRSSLVQLDTPDEMRGRVSAVNYVFIGASNQLGEFESGVTASWFGTVVAVVIGGAGTLAIAALWMRLFPALKNRNALLSAPPLPEATIAQAAE